MSTGWFAGDPQAVGIDRIGDEPGEHALPFRGVRDRGLAGAGVGLEQRVEQPAEEGEVVVRVRVGFEAVVFRRAHRAEFQLAVGVFLEAREIAGETAWPLASSFLDAVPVAGETELPPVVVHGPGEIAEGAGFRNPAKAGRNACPPHRGSCGRGPGGCRRRPASR